ncbi:MAG: glycosyltransferase, partial [Nostoc sp.]
MRSRLVYEGLTGENGAISAIVPDVSVVVPIHNEVESLPLLLEAIASTLFSSQINYEIICVDDG